MHLIAIKRGFEFERVHGVHEKVWREKREWRNIVIIFKSQK